MSQSILDKLQLQEEKNVLIQGLPSSIEKHFVKVSFAKNVTPLLKSRKIDFALIFALNEQQLCNILKDVLPALHKNAKFWISHPKSSSKILTNLSKESSWDVVVDAGFAKVEEVELDHTWVAGKWNVRDLVEICEEVHENAAAMAH